MYRIHLGFALNMLALGLLFPGILLPMFNLNMEMLAAISGTELHAQLVDKELSIIATVRELWQDDRLLVAALIFGFSVCIPLLKGLLVAFAYLKRNSPYREKIIAFVGSIGKWSMADVFVVAVFLAVLSTNHAETTNSKEFAIFGFQFALDISTQTLSAVGEGFYYFTAYCILSLLGTQLTGSYRSNSH